MLLLRSPFIPEFNAVVMGMLECDPHVRLTSSAAIERLEALAQLYPLPTDTAYSVPAEGTVVPN